MAKGRVWEWGGVTTGGISGYQAGNTLTLNWRHVTSLADVLSSSGGKAFHFWVGQHIRNRNGHVDFKTATVRIPCGFFPQRAVDIF